MSKSQLLPSAVLDAQPLADSGVFTLAGDVCLESVLPIVEGIIATRFLPEWEQPQQITIMLNTPGGDGAAMWQLIDNMCLCQIPICTMGFGQVASAGIFILAAGDKGLRYISPNTMLMSHQYSTGYGGKEHELQSAVKEVSIISEMMMAHYIKHTGKSETYIRKHLLPASDCYLTPAEAVKHGIADKILGIPVK